MCTGIGRFALFMTKSAVEKVVIPVSVPIVLGLAATDKCWNG